MTVAARFAKLAELVLRKIFARLRVPHRACLVAVLNFTSFFHMLLTTDVTEFVVVEMVLELTKVDFFMFFSFNFSEKRMRYRHFYH